MKHILTIILFYTAYKIVKRKRKYHLGGIVHGMEQRPLESLDGEIITMFESGEQYIVINGELIRLGYRPRFLGR